MRKGSIEEIGAKYSPVKNHTDGLRLILSCVGEVSCVGHRVVHGAESFVRPVIINKSILGKIKKLSRLAPLHNPANISGITACKKILKSVPQVAVFDTAFHQTMPEYAYVYGLPYEYYTGLKIRRYGFHGTSHEYVARQAAGLLGKSRNMINLITCHLGNGVSISAIKNGKSIDTSMGFTPLEGLMMGTRCGDIDPALIGYIMRAKKTNINKIEDILNRESGLKGVSGVSNDMRQIIKSADFANRRARLAIDIFVYRIKKYIGAYMAILGRVDMVVFTGGIGENQPRIRGKITRGLFDNLRKAPKVSVIKTREELLIAEKAYELIKNHK